MNAAQKGKLMRMAGNIAAGLASEWAFDKEIVARKSIEIAEEIIRQIEEKYPDRIELKAPEK